MTEEEKAAAELKAQEEAAKEGKEYSKEDIENMSYDEAKAYAEKLEAENKGDSKDQDAEKKANMIKRIEKAKDKGKVETPNTEEIAKTPETLNVRDEMTLEKKGYSNDSDEAKLIKQYADMPINAGKNYQELIENNAGLKAELDVFKTDNTAKKVVDENDTDEFRLNTKKDNQAKYRADGTVPTGTDAINELAKDNLKSMGI